LSDDSSATADDDSASPAERRWVNVHDARRVKGGQEMPNRHVDWKINQVRKKHKRHREKTWMLLGRKLDQTREQMFWDDTLERYLAPPEAAWSWFKLCYDQAVKEADLWWDSRQNDD
jgi:hypothetical protein